MRKQTNRKFNYTVFTVRIEKNIKNFLKKENKKYKSWNLFFRELKNRYDKNGRL